MLQHKFLLINKGAMSDVREGESESGGKQRIEHICSEARLVQAAFQLNGAWISKRDWLQVWFFASARMLAKAA